MLQTPYPFTPKGEAALRQAEHLARRLHHKYIGTEHLLLGLLTQNGGIAYTVPGVLCTEAARSHGGARPGVNRASGSPGIRGGRQRHIAGTDAAILRCAGAERW